jgi:putative oxidoreductase
LLTAVLFHVDFSVPMQQISFMKNIALSGGLLYIFANGAGKFSLDTRKKKFT